MAIKEMIVFLGGEAASEVRLAIAIEIARDHGALLIGAYVTSEAILGRHPDGFARGAGVDAVVARETASKDADAARMARRFADLTHAQGVDAEWLPIARYGTAADAVLRARHADLTIVGQSTGDESNALWQFEDMLFAFGGPTLIVPTHASTPITVGQNILVAWDASREAKRAVADAMPLLVKADRVTILVVDPGAMTAQTRESGAALVRQLAHHGFSSALVEVASGGRTVGRAILEQTGQVGADLIVMGAYGDWRIIEWVFGGVTRTVLKEMPVPVLMAH